MNGGYPLALRKIVIEGDNVLRKISKEVAFVDHKICDLLDDMKETMYHSNGVGLAAVQVGILKRIFIMDLRDDRGYIELINPAIIERSGEQTSNEGCLSIPDYVGEVLRPSYIKIKGLDRNGKECVLEGEGLFAICVSHEYDHLDGILFKDKVVS
jgi:peptide deformylase